MIQRSAFRSLFVAGPVILFGTPAIFGQTGDARRGQAFFQQSCAICHSDTASSGGESAVRQGPSLVGVFGRRAATGPKYSYTKALSESGLTWDAPSLDRFLTNPAAAVPGTTMPIPVPDAGARADVIAYLATLRQTVAAAPAPAVSPKPAAPSCSSDWRNAAPGVKHRIDLANLPAPFATTSAGNGPRVAGRPAGAQLAVPPGFTVRQFASGFTNPRAMRTAPNGDIFVAETAANRLRILRAPDGAEAPTENVVFAEKLDRPFGTAFYPLTGEPRWLYVANINSVVRLPYHSGDLKATGPAEVIVPKLTDGAGGHSTRDIAFSPDGKRMFISVGSGSNVAEGMGRKTPEAIAAWEAEHGLGAAWGSETNRASILVCDPEGKTPLKTFASGIRNGVGITIQPETGKLWTSTNERDGLGDDLVPEYVTSVKEGAFYGWPWYYMGAHEDPRHKGERPDLRDRVTVPDVPMQPHSASLEMVFYPSAPSGPAAFPAEYRGDAFAAFHGSWNRTVRTGYKVARIRFDHGKPTGEYEDFLTGFGVDDRSVWGRPVGVTVAHDGALLVSEDGNGTIWRVAPGGK